MKKFYLLSTLFLSLSHVIADDNLTNPTILYIGDSHSYGKLGMVVEKNLSTISDHVVMEASCGATASTWLGQSGFEKTVCGFWKKEGSDESRTVKHQVPKLSDELAKYRPQVVIVQLGTNMAAGSSPSKSAKSILEMMNEIKEANAQCIWIGPPDANSKIVTREKLKIVNGILIDLAAKNNCFYINSLSLTIFPKNSSEGIHYPPNLSTAWGEKISSAILNSLSH